jgi:hypothetical protein
MTALKSVLICLILIAGAFPSVVAAERKAPKLPDGFIRTTYLLSQPKMVGKFADPVRTKHALRAFALTRSDELVDRNLAWVRGSDWSPAFKVMFARAVAWAR